MTTRHPQIEDNPVEKRIAHKGKSREVEPKVAMDDAWLARMDADADSNVCDNGMRHLEFDIAAWFALDQDDEFRSKCMTECWYG